MARTGETLALTLLALLAFAGNSLLTRLALGAGVIDAASFTAVRLFSGAVVLALIVCGRAGGWRVLRGGRAASALALFGYAAPFSFAYLRIGAAVGALVLFGAVQLTMIGWGVGHGERPGGRTWLGLVLAAAGLGALTLPAASRPDLVGVVLMAGAGVAWGAYSLQGKTAGEPLAANARAFIGTLPLALVLVLVMAGLGAIGPRAQQAQGVGRGLLLATISGGLTSALGYALWYRALRGLTATRAAIVQLSVPVIAALGASVLLGERLSVHLALCGLAVLGGVALALSARAPAVQKRPDQVAATPPSPGDTLSPAASIPGPRNKK